MRRATLTWRILGSLAAIVILAWSLVSAIAYVSRHSDPVNRRWPAQGINLLEIRLDSSEVEIVGVHSNEITLNGTITSDLFGADHREIVEGDRLIVSMDCAFHPGPVNCSSKYRMEVPVGLDLEFRGRNSEVVVGELDGSVDVETSNSRIRAENLRGDSRLVTSNDEINALGIGPGPTTLRTSNGSIRAVFGEPPDQVSAKSSNDPVRLVLPRTAPAYAVEVKTSNGDRTVAVRADPNSPNKIRAKTSNADVSITYGRK